MARKTASKKKSKTPAKAKSADGGAAGVRPAARSANIVQLHRARGQVDGVERMIQEDRYCADIIVQIIAARASLQVVAKDLLANHLKMCHKAANDNGGEAADKMYQELIDLVSKMAR